MKHNKEFKRPNAGDKDEPRKPVHGPKFAPPKKTKPKDKKTDLSAHGAAETISQRKAYNEYRIEAVTSGGQVLSFEEWRGSKGLQPPVGGGN